MGYIIYLFLKEGQFYVSVKKNGLKISNEIITYKHKTLKTPTPTV